MLPLYLNRFRGEPAITKLVQPNACSLLDRLVSGQIL